MTATDLTIRVVKSDPFRAQLEIIGVLDDEGASLVSGVLASHLKGGRRLVQVGMSSVARVTDSALVALAHAHQLFVDGRSTLVFAAVTPEVRERVWQLGLDRILLLASADHDAARQIA
jgi:anti-anti-sigma regulatory factor